MGTFQAGFVCCQSGTCAPSSAACPGLLLGIGEGESMESEPLVPVEPYYAAYSRTLCRVLNECGDGDEQPCTDEIVPEPCTETGCCAVSGVPP